MPTGNVTLLESVKWGSNVLKKGVTEIIVRESPILGRLPMEKIKGNALERTIEDTLPTVQYRKVNQNYTRSFGTDKNVFWGTSILGGEVFVDNYIVRTRGDRGDVKARQFAKVAKAAALTFDRDFFDGLGTADDFKGVNALLDEGNDFGQVYTPNANGGALTLDDLDIAHDLLRGGSADVILGTRAQRRKITKLARESVSGVALIDVGDDKFGRQVTQWNGIPIGIVGDGPDGNLILGYDETTGSSNVTSSLYFIRFGIDEGVSGLFGAEGYFEVRDFGEIEASPGHLGRIEFYPGIMIASKWSVVRYKGITA